MAGGQGSEVELGGDGVDVVADDDLLTKGVVDDNLTEAFGALNIEVAAGGVGVEVDVEGLHLVDAHMAGDGNPVVGGATLVAGGLEVHVGVAVNGEGDVLGGAEGSALVVLEPLVGVVVGGVVDGGEGGDVSGVGVEVPVAFDGHFGGVVDGEVQAANGVATFGILDAVEGDGLGGGGGVGLVGEGPEVAVASSDIVVFVGFVLDSYVEVDDGVVAVLLGAKAADEGGVDTLGECMGSTEGEDESVADGGVNDFGVLAMLGSEDGEVKGVVGLAASVEVGGVEGVAVLVGVIDTACVVIAVVAGTAAGTCVEAIGVFFAGGDGDGVVVVNDGQGEVAVFYAGGGGVGHSVDAILGVGDVVDSPTVETAALNEGGVMLDSGERSDADGHEAVAATNGGGADAVEDLVGVTKGIGGAEPLHTATTFDVANNSVGGVEETVDDGKVDDICVAVGGGGGCVDMGIGATGGERVAVEDVSVASGDGLMGGVGIVQGDVDPNDGVAATGGGDSVEESAFFGPCLVVPEDNAVARYLTDIHGVVVAVQHGEVEYIGGVGGVTRLLVENDSVVRVLNTVNSPQEFAADRGVGGY